MSVNSETKPRTMTFRPRPSKTRDRFSCFTAAKPLPWALFRDPLVPEPHRDHEGRWFEFPHQMVATRPYFLFTVKNVPTVSRLSRPFSSGAVRS